MPFAIGAGRSRRSNRKGRRDPGIGTSAQTSFSKALQGTLIALAGGIMSDAEPLGGFALAETLDRDRDHQVRIRADLFFEMAESTVIVVSASR